MMEKVKYYFSKAWAPTAVITVIFFIHYFFFGQENTIIGPFVTLTFLRLRGMGNYKGCMIRNFAVYAVMAVLSFVAMLGAAANVLVNAAALFWIAYFLIDEFWPNNYFPAGMALVFFQIAPVLSMAALVRRVLALAAAFLIVFIFLLILDRQSKLSKVSDVVLQGLDLSRLLCDVILKDSRQAAQISRQLCSVNRRLCNEIYHHNRSQLGRNVRVNRYCIFVAAFQEIISLADCFQKTESEGTAIDHQQVSEFPAGFQKTESEGIAEEIRKLSEKYAQIYEHIEKKRYSGAQAEKKEDKDYSRINHCPQSRMPLMAEKKLKIRVNHPDMRSFRLRFALRQVCVLTPCLAFGYFSSWPNRYWLTISVFFMMIPLYERTFGRIAQRMKGTLFGLLLCIVLFAVCRTMPLRILMMTVFNFFIYCSGGYTAMVTCITCSALALNFTESNYMVMLLQRMMYTVVGAVIAWAGNTWVFPIRASKQIQYIKDLFHDICIQMEQTSELSKEESVVAMNQLLIRSYLLAGRMEDLNEALPEDKKCADCHAFLKGHLQTIAHLMLAEN